MIEAAIFDMDGLLIDSEPFWRDAHVEAVARYGHSITHDDVRAMAGHRTDEVVAKWKDRFGLGPEADGLEDEVVNEVIRRIKIEGQALPGVAHAIDLFAAHRVPMAVASSSAPPVIEAVLEGLDLKQHVQFGYSAKHEKFGKPHPGVFLTAARKLGAKPADCLVLEDALSGVRAAKKAGMKCIAVPEAVNLTKIEFEEADLVLESLQNLAWERVVALWN